MEREIKYNRPWSLEDLAYLKGNIDNKSNVYLSKLMGRTINSLESMKRDIRKGKKIVPDLWYKSYTHKRPSYGHWISKSQAYTKLYVLHKEANSRYYTEVSKGTPEAKMERRMEKTPTCIDAHWAGLKINTQPTKQQSKDMLIALAWGVALMIVGVMTYYLINQNK